MVLVVLLDQNAFFERFKFLDLHILLLQANDIALEFRELIGLNGNEGVLLGDLLLERFDNFLVQQHRGLFYRLSGLLNLFLLLDIFGLFLNLDTLARVGFKLLRLSILRLFLLFFFRLFFLTKLRISTLEIFIKFDQLVHLLIIELHLLHDRGVLFIKLAKVFLCLNPFGLVLLHLNF